MLSPRLTIITGRHLHTEAYTNTLACMFKRGVDMCVCVCVLILLVVHKAHFEFRSVCVCVCVCVCVVSLGDTQSPLRTQDCVCVCVHAWALRVVSLVHKAQFELRTAAAKDPPLSKSLHDLCRGVLLCTHTHTHQCMLCKLQIQIQIHTHTRTDTRLTYVRRLAITYRMHTHKCVQFTFKTITRHFALIAETAGRQGIMGAAARSET